MESGRRIHPSGRRADSDTDCDDYAFADPDSDSNSYRDKATASNSAGDCHRYPIVFRADQPTLVE